MNHFIIFETKHWLVSHRMDSRYPGYLIISSREAGAKEISKLSKEALLQVGSVLSEAEQLLNLTFSSYKVIIAKMGFSEGFNFHFHMIPVMSSLLPADY